MKWLSYQAEKSEVNPEMIVNIHAYISIKHTIASSPLKLRGYSAVQNILLRSFKDLTAVIKLLDIKDKRA